MKKLFVLISAPFFMYAGNAGAQSMLKIRLSDNSQRITVAVDGRYFNKLGTSITVGDLPYGNHNLKIYGITYNRHGRPKENLIYDASVKTYNGMLSTVIYDPESGNQSVQETDMNAYANNRNLPQQQAQPANGGMYDNQATQGNDQGNNTMTESDNNGGPVASPIATGSLTDAKMAALKKNVADKKTDTQKTTALKDGLKDERINTAQVAEMMDWFTFEASKVDFAKWAYKITVDKEYYSDLENKFSYKASQDELDKFIKDANH